MGVGPVEAIPAEGRDVEGAVSRQPLLGPEGELVARGMGLVAPRERIAGAVFVAIKAGGQQAKGALEAQPLRRLPASLCFEAVVATLRRIAREVDEFGAAVVPDANDGGADLLILALHPEQGEGAGQGAVGGAASDSDFPVPEPLAAEAAEILRERAIAIEAAGFIAPAQCEVGRPPLAAVEKQGGATTEERLLGAEAHGGAVVVAVPALLEAQSPLKVPGAGQRLTKLSKKRTALRFKLAREGPWGEGVIPQQVNRAPVLVQAQGPGPIPLKLLEAQFGGAGLPIPTVAIL